MISRAAVLGLVACSASSSSVPAFLTCDDGQAPVMVEGFAGAATGSAACGSGSATLVQGSGDASDLAIDNGSLAMTARGASANAGCVWNPVSATNSVVVHWRGIGSSVYGSGNGVTEFTYAGVSIDVAAGSLSTSYGNRATPWAGETWWRIRTLDDLTASADVSRDGIDWSTLGSGAWPRGEVAMSVGIDGTSSDVTLEHSALDAIYVCP